MKICLWRYALKLNIEKNLILIKGEDKTEQISYCEYESSKWHIVYYNNSKVYSYAYLNVEWYRNPTIKNAGCMLVYENKQPLSGISKIIEFEKHYRIIYKSGFQKIYPKSRILVEDACLNNPNAND
jgi:hypothetical protein